VHATAVTYVTVVALTVVTFVVFFVANSMQGGHNWSAMRASAKVPLYFNPVFFLIMAFAPPRQLYPEWTTCAAIFLAMALVSVLLTLYNLRRAGEGT